MSYNLYRVLALVPALVGTSAHALGIGGIRLQSALDQPFVGEIDLVDVKPDELDAVKVQIAPQAEFSRSGTERYHYLTKLRFSPQISPRGNPVIRVTSREPVREPYMDFLVEVVWPKGRLVKQYTVLLDPPVTTARPAPRVAQPVVAARSPAAPAQPPEARSPKPPSAPPAPSVEPPRSAPVGAAAGGGKRFGPIRPGTGLWRLARNNTPPGATVSQTAMALYRNNQDAFVNGNINRMIVGKTLTMPSAGELFALSPEAARREFSAAIKGETVRRTLMADAAAPGAPAGQGDSRLRIAGVAAADAAKAKGGAVAGAGEGMEKELLLVQETSESARQETVELRARIRELEAKLAEIQGRLTPSGPEAGRVPGEAGAAPGVLSGVKIASQTVGQDARSTPAGLPPGTTTAPAAPRDLKGTPNATGGAPPEGDAATASAGAPAGVRSQPPAAGTGAGAGSAAIPAVAAPPSTGTAPPVASRPGAEASVRPPAVAPTTAPPPPPEATPVAVTPVPETPPRPSSVTGAPGKAPAGAAPQVATVTTANVGSSWHSWLLPLAGLAGLTALGAGALAWIRSRRRVGRDSSVEFDSSEHSGDAVTPPARSRPSASVSGSVSGSAAGASSVGGGPGVSGSGEGSSTGAGMVVRGEPETDEADAVSEADIYIAYGRYREAEDLLREEIRRTPDRLELKFKLAEAYHGAKNIPALRELMQEVRAAGGDQSNPAQWQRLFEMAAVASSDAASEGLPASARPPLRSTAGSGLVSAPADGVLVESVDSGSAEAYTLDISDARKPSADLAVLGEALPGSGAPPSLPSSGAGRGRLGAGLPELELSLDDSRLGDDVEPYALVDSAPAGALSSGAKAGGDDSLSSTAAANAWTQMMDPRTTPPPSGPARASAPEDSGSSDLLSSHWQLDSGLWDETATKLDLARAYIEMGDKESAKGILEEVVGEGSEEQRTEARELLRRAG